MTGLLLVVSAVILISAFCSMCESALYSVSESYIESLVSNGSPSGKLIRSLRQDIDRPITAILSLNTVANTAGAAVAGAMAAQVFGENWLVAFSAVFTFSILVLAEVVPKTVGVVYNRPLAVMLARPLSFMVTVFTPVIWICRFATKSIAGTNTESEITAEEIVIMAHLGKKSGAIESDEYDIIRNVLSVREKSVRDVMTPRSVLFMVDGDLLISDIIKEKDLYAHSRVPVYLENPDEIVGVVHRTDLLAKVAAGNETLQLRSIMKPVHFVLATTTLDVLLKLFLKKRQHLFVALNEFNDPCGVVTLEDVIEEILGSEIVDEFDETVDMQQLARQTRSELIAKTKKK